MQKTVPVSIIIPTLNEEDIIEGFLQQLLAISDIEIIVSDGGSNDNTGAICAGYPVKLVKSARGRGPQLNAGADAASGDILFFLHADSRIEPRIIDDIRQAVASGHQWGCCTLSFDNINPFFNIIAWQSNLRSRRFSSCYGDQGIYCCRDFFYEAGPYPPVVFLEDMALSNILRRKSRARVLEGVITTSSRRFSDQGILRTIVKMQIAKVLFRLGFEPERIIKWYQPGFED